MIIKDALHITHRLLGGSNHKGCIQSKAQQQCSCDREKCESTFHSASRTASNISRQAVVKTTSYATSSAIQKVGDVSPVSTAAVEFTMPSNAGIDSGNKSSGNMISRARVRRDIAAKKVPFTTSAHVPRTAMGISCQLGPSGRNL